MLHHLVGLTLSHHDSITVFGGFLRHPAKKLQSMSLILASPFLIKIVSGITWKLEMDLISEAHYWHDTVMILRIQGTVYIYLHYINYVM